MKLLPTIKQRIAQARSGIYRSAIRTWKTSLKPWHYLILLSDKKWKIAFELLRVIFGIIFGILAIALLVLIFWRVFSGTEAIWVDNLLGTSGLEEGMETTIKWQTIKTLGQALFGFVLIFGIYVAYRRALAMEKTAQAQYDANEQEIFNEATDKLGHESASVRLGGIYGLSKLTRSNKEYLENIAEILCAHLRETTQQTDYQEKYKDKPSNEIQSLLNTLSRLNAVNEEDNKFNPLRLDLSESYLVGANLDHACLNHVNLAGAYMQRASLRWARIQWANLDKAQMQRATLVWAQMQGANLNEAQMQEAYLMRAQMQEAYLMGAQMQRAVLRGAQLQGAALGGAQLQGADLSEAQLQGAALGGAQLQGANLSEAQLQRAILIGAQMQGADLSKTQLQGANLMMAKMQGANLNEAQLQGADLSEANLQGAYTRDESPLLISLIERIQTREGKPPELENLIFKGGLTLTGAQRIQEKLTKCQKNEWMTKEEVSRINAILMKHQDKPAVKQLPKDSGAITGVLTKEEANKIIAKYEAAMASIKKTGP